LLSQSHLINYRVAFVLRPVKHLVLLYAKVYLYENFYTAMLQVPFIKQNAALVKERLAIKYFNQPELIDELIHWDDKRKQCQQQLDELQASINGASKKIGQLLAAGQKEAAEQAKTEVAALKQQQNYQQLAEVEKKIENILYLLPNLPSTAVPMGKTPNDNVIVRQAGAIPSLPEGSLPHWDLAKKLNLIDFELGNKITGSGFPVYIHKGAKLQRALIQYFLDYNTAAGYIEYLPPLLVNEASAYGTGQLPDKEGQMYYATEDNYYLIPTAEVPVTNVYRDTIVREAELPIKMTAYTPCFRREAGSYGKDVRGLNRLHQFDKVEIIQLTHPEKSNEVLEEMIAHVEQLLQSLALPYRLLRLCGGDMGFASAITYDFEVYSAAQEKWLEVSSVSNFESYQTNRLKARFKDAKGKTQMLHSLNGSSLALPRIVACLLENNQTADGILLPAVLHSYFGEKKIGREAEVKS
jgi:seryl-tRNA synthetase